MVEYADGYLDIFNVTGKLGLPTHIGAGRETKGKQIIACCFGKISKSEDDLLVFTQSSIEGEIDGEKDLSAHILFKEVFMYNKQN